MNDMTYRKFLESLVFLVPLALVAPERSRADEPLQSEEAELSAEIEPFFFINFFADGDAGQCNGLANGVQATALGDWSQAIRLDTDNRPGGCFQQFAIFDPGHLLDGLVLEVNIFPDGQAQCDSPGERIIPISASGIVWSSAYRIDTDNRPGGCQQVFTLEGRDDIVFDVAFFSDGNSGQCGGIGVHTVDTSGGAQIRLDMDQRDGGCRQQFNLRRR
jgi:hypothetical protein